MGSPVNVDIMQLIGSSGRQYTVINLLVTGRQRRVGCSICGIESMLRKLW